MDHPTFNEFFKLPGIINDRFYKLMINKETKVINQHSFIATLTKIFMSKLETRMKVTFDMYYSLTIYLLLYRYDFDNDGRISMNDIRLVFSYIPLQDPQ